MNLHHLTVFREVMETGSMSRAARNLGRSQPAVSLALKALEDELGITLFERDTRNLKPVPEAQYLLSEANSILTQFAQLQRTMKRMQTGDRGEVNVAAMPGVSTVLFPDFLAEFAASRPDVRLSLHTRSSTQLRELVSSQGVDLGFGDYAGDSAQTLKARVTRVSADGFLALPARHPLSGCETVALSELDGAILGGMQPEHRFEKQLQARLTQAGIATTVRFRSQTVLPLLRFVASGLCVAIVDPLTVASAGLTGMDRDAVVFRRLSVPIRYDYAILVPQLRPLSALARNVAAAWQDYLVETLDGLGAAPGVDSATAAQISPY